MSVEILSVSLDDETIEKLADAVSARMSGQVGVYQENVAATASRPPEQPQDDPWAGTNAQAAPQAQTQQQPAQAQRGPTVPSCIHGEMRYVPGGFSRSNNKPYAAFYGCPTPRGTPNQCKSQPA